MIDVVLVDATATDGGSRSISKSWLAVLESVRKSRNEGRVAETTMRAGPEWSCGTLFLPSGRVRRIWSLVHLASEPDLWSFQREQPRRLAVLLDRDVECRQPRARRARHYLERAVLPDDANRLFNHDFRRRARPATK